MSTPLRRGSLPCMMAVLAAVAVTTLRAQPAAKPANVTSKPISAKETQKAKYDFVQVVEKYKQSMNPLNEEMKTTFKNLEASFEDANELMKQGKIRESLETSSKAIEEVVAIKNKVLVPLRENRDFLIDKTGQVNIRLAEALEAKMTSEKMDTNSIPAHHKKQLTQLAMLVKNTKDPKRRADLYRRFKRMEAMVLKSRPATSKTDPVKIWSAIAGALNKAKGVQLNVIRNTEDMFTNFQFAHTELALQAEAAAAAKSVDELIKALGGDGEGDYENTLGGQIKKLSQMQDNIGNFTSQMNTEIETTMKSLEMANVTDPTSPLYAPEVTDADIANDLLIQQLTQGQ